MYICLATACMPAPQLCTLVLTLANLLSGSAILNLTLYHITPSLKVICVDSPQFTVRHIQNSYLAAVVKLISLATS